MIKHRIISREEMPKINERIKNLIKSVTSDEEDSDVEKPPTMSKI